MSKEQIDEYERYINQVAADTEVVKIVLTAMIALLSAKRGTALVDDLELVTRQALELALPEAQDHPLTHRLHRLKLSRAEDYFRDLRTLVTGSLPPVGSKN